MCAGGSNLELSRINRLWLSMLNRYIPAVNYSNKKETHNIQGIILSGSRKPVANIEYIGELILHHGC